MSGFTVHREPLLSVLQELVPLWTDYHKESGKLYKQPFVVDWALVLLLAQQNKIALYTLRCGSELVGYNAFVITRIARHAASLFAVNEAIYVKPDYRDPRAVFRLLADAEKDLAASGIHAIRYTSIPYFKQDKGGLGKLYKFFGARLVETVYEKTLTPANAGKRRHGNRRDLNKRTAKPVHTAVSTTRLQ